MRSITTYVVAGALALGLAVGTTAAASGSAPAPAAAALHRAPAPIDPQITGQGVVPQAGFIAITPCRAVDTRKSPAGSMSAGTARNFVVGGNVGFENQGGRPGGCGLRGADAAVLSVTTTNTVGSGYLVAWPTGQPMPTATALTDHNAFTETAEVTSKIGISNQISITAASASTDVIVDVVGYYRESIAARVTAAGAAVYASNHVTSVQRLAVGLYRIHFSVNVIGCVGVGSADYSTNNVSVNMESLSALVIVRDLTSQNTSTDGGFALLVNC